MLSYSRARGVFGVASAVREYNSCCPPLPPRGTCSPPPSVPGAGRRIVPPADCRPGDIPPNPCVPRFHDAHTSYRKYKYLTLFVAFPMILMQLFIVSINHCVEPKEGCREYEYMRRRDHKYPWSDGKKTFFHNDHVNYLPGECEAVQVDCD